MRRASSVRMRSRATTVSPGGKTEPGTGEDAVDLDRRSRRIVRPTGNPMAYSSGVRTAKVPSRWSTFDACDVSPRLAAVAAGVHRQRAADGARDAGEELGVGAAVHRREARELRARDARVA
jgi:hypothetical protein